MRRSATWLVVGGILALAGVAVVEAFVRGEERTPDAEALSRALPSTAADDEPSDLLREAGASGLLYLSTPDGERCELQIVRLPGLALETGFGIPDCRFAVSSEGVIATGSECPATGAGTLWDASGVFLAQFSGCAPAWKPSGDLTFVRNGNVMATSRSCVEPSSIDECAQVVLPAGEIRRGFTTRPGDPPARVIVRELGWLDDSRLGILLSRIVGLGIGDASGDYFVVFEGRHSLGLESEDPASWSDLAVDRSRRQFYLSGAGPPSALDDRGLFASELALPQGFAQADALALSPEGAWVAAAGRARVELFQRGEPPGQTFPMPFGAVELEWHGP